MTVGLRNQHHRSRGPARSPGLSQGPVSCLGCQGPCRCAQDADSPEVPGAGVTVRRVSREMGPASPLSCSPGADGGRRRSWAPALTLRRGAAEGNLPGTGSAGPGGAQRRGSGWAAAVALDASGPPPPPAGTPVISAARPPPPVPPP